MKIIGKGKQEIHSYEDWNRPMSPTHWAEGRSAMEIARAFFRHGEPRLPEALTTLLRSKPATANFVADEAHPEFCTSLPPSGANGPRHHDVWLRGYSHERKVGVGIEAKADEAFGTPLARGRAKALARIESGKATRWLERMKYLGPRLFGPTFDSGNPIYQRIGWQLISGVAGTVIQAASDKANIAVFVVYEFSTNKTNRKKQSLNAGALNEFVGLLPGGHHGPAPGSLVGPFKLGDACSMPLPVELYIGKVSDCLICRPS